MSALEQCFSNFQCAHEIPGDLVKMQFQELRHGDVRFCIFNKFLGHAATATDKGATL